MKNSVLWKLSAAFAGLAGCLSLSVSSMAAVPAGTLEGADESSVYGWVWDSDNYNHIIPVEISIYPAGSSQTLKTATIKADDYQDKLQESIGDGYHGFLYSVDWNQFQQTEFRVTAYTAEDESVFLGELTYNKETRACVVKNGTQAEEGRTAPQTSPASDKQDTESPAGPDAGSASPAGKDEEDTAASPEAGQDTAGTASAKKDGQDAADDSRSSKKYQAPWESGPGVPQPEPPKEEPKYVSLGIFATTGYCSCEKCCPSGSSLTYSGTVPQANHTISADISVFPIGTRLMINDIIYTVEDIGSNVIGNKLDIYYATHEEAEDHGVIKVEVFSVPEEEAS